MAERAELVTLAARVYAETLSGNKVASRLDVSRTTAYRLLHAAGIDLPDRHGPIVNSRKQKLHGEASLAVARDYAAGLPMFAIKAKHGVGSCAIKSAAQRAGVPERPRGGRVKGFTDERLAEASRLYASGLSQAQIAASFGMGLSTVNRALRLAGVKVRRCGAHGPAHGSWKGGRIVTSQGYVRVLVDRNDPLAMMADKTGYVLEHRLTMARAIGRPLTRGETVHHKDGNRSHNALSNLQLRFGQHGMGVVMICANCGSDKIVCTEISD